MQNLKSAAQKMGELCNLKKCKIRKNKFATFFRMVNMNLDKNLKSVA